MIYQPEWSHSGPGHGRINLNRKLLRFNSVLPWCLGERISSRMTSQGSDLKSAGDFRYPYAHTESMYDMYGTYIFLHEWLIFYGN